MKVYRVTIANIDEGEMLHRLSKIRLNATVFSSAGVWYDDTGTAHIESGVTFETANDNLQRILEFVIEIINELGEVCAYFTVDGAAPTLVYANGSISTL